MTPDLRPCDPFRPLADARGSVPAPNRDRKAADLAVRALVAPAVLLVAVALVLAPLHTRQSKKTMKVFASAGEPIAKMTAELERVQPEVPRGAHLFFEDDPFPPHSYSLLFLARLFYHDLTIEVARAKDGAAVGGGPYDAVLRWANGKLVRAAAGRE